MSKFNCPNCNHLSTVNNVIGGRSGIIRYRACRVCKTNFSTVEAVKETPRLRQVLGEDKAAALWGKAPFKYRTIAQQKRAIKPAKPQWDD